MSLKKDVSLYLVPGVRRAGTIRQKHRHAEYCKNTLSDRQEDVALGQGIENRPDNSREEKEQSKALLAAVAGARTPFFFPSALGKRCGQPQDLAG